MKIICLVLILLLLFGSTSYAAIDILRQPNKSHSYQNNLNITESKVTSINYHNNHMKDKNTSDIEWQSRNLVTKNDEYVSSNQQRCLQTQNLISCLKYKTAKVVWTIATNGLEYFPNEHSRALREDTRHIRLIQLGEPSDLTVFNDAKILTDDSEWNKFYKFLKRAVETFGRNHGIQIAFPGNIGARVTRTDIETPRGRLHEKKKRKWLIILPLIILMKIAHLKMTMVTLFLATLGLNVLLVGGVGWLIHYLKFKTLCKIHPHLVQSHSHVYDSDPAEYSSFVGSSVPSSYYSGSGASNHEIGLNGYSKDWASRKAYNGPNFLDTISKRVN